MDRARNPVTRRVGRDIDERAALFKELAARPGLDRGEAARLRAARGKDLGEAKVGFHSQPVQRVVTNAADYVRTIGRQRTVLQLTRCGELHVRMVEIAV